METIKTDNTQALYNALARITELDAKRTQGDLLPCPFCGCKNVFIYICFDTAVCECQDCGARPSNPSVTVMYKRDNPPKELEGVPTYEATAFAIQKKDGGLLEYPEHGYVGVSAPLAFKAYGVLDRWNARAMPEAVSIITELEEKLRVAREALHRISTGTVWTDLETPDDDGNVEALESSWEAIIAREVLAQTSMED